MVYIGTELLPGSWHSKDIFTPHPTILDVWNYVTQIDDRVILLNGEKVLPLSIEERVREDKIIREALLLALIAPYLVFSSSAQSELIQCLTRLISMPSGHLLQAETHAPKPSPRSPGK